MNHSPSGDVISFYFTSHVFRQASGISRHGGPALLLWVMCLLRMKALGFVCSNDTHYHVSQSLQLLYMAVDSFSDNLDTNLEVSLMEDNH
jgi:hypothetical protein